MPHSSKNNHETAPIIVGLGEALFDVFADRRVLGGAPLNVAVQAQQLAAVVGGRGIVASRVGKDELGDDVRRELAERDMTADYLQVDAQKPTGRVNVTLDDGEPEYEIETGVAWDALEFSPRWQELAAACQAVCFGTLAQRSEESRRAIHRFVVQASSAFRLFDVNLRQHYYDRDTIEESCRVASAVKLNEAELQTVAHLLEMGEVPDEQNADNQNAVAEQLRQRYDLDFVALTRGEQGTMLLTGDGRFEGPVPRYPRDANADSVGAGDACSAGLLLGWSLGWPHERTVALANHAGAFVASVSGATPTLPAECLQLVR